jgi:hypothetical protein
MGNKMRINKLLTVIRLVKRGEAILSIIRKGIRMRFLSKGIRMRFFFNQIKR